MVFGARIHNCSNGWQKITVSQRKEEQKKRKEKRKSRRCSLGSQERTLDAPCHVVLGPEKDAHAPPCKGIGSAFPENLSEFQIWKMVGACFFIHGGQIKQEELMTENNLKHLKRPNNLKRDGALTVNFIYIDCMRLCKV
ncbi:unnamed protein product [Victoria cruziana]